MKTPLLSTLFLIFGWIDIIGGIVLAVVLLIDGRMARVEAFGYGGACVIAGAFCFGLAEAVEYLAEAAYYARLTYERLEAPAQKDQRNRGDYVLLEALR